jgi:hypothetical protein
MRPLLPVRSTDYPFDRLPALSITRSLVLPVGLAKRMNRSFANPVAIPHGHELLPCETYELRVFSSHVGLGHICHFGLCAPPARHRSALHHRKYYHLYM